MSQDIYLWDPEIGGIPVSVEEASERLEWLLQA